MHTPVLDALLDSVAPMVDTSAILDLTAASSAAAWLARRTGEATRPVAQEPALVLADHDDWRTALAHADGRALVLLRSPTATLERFDEHLRKQLTKLGWRVAARVKAQRDHWRLLVPQACRTDHAYAVSLIIVCQDQARQLYETCLRLAETPTDFKWELVVVDRGSFDQTPALLRGLSGDVQVINVSRELSITESYDRGIRRAQAPVSLLARPDTQVVPEKTLEDADTESQAVGPLLLAGLLDSEPDEKHGAPRRLPHGADEGWWMIDNADYRAREGFDLSQPWPRAYEHFLRTLREAARPRGEDASTHSDQDQSLSA